MRLRKYPVGLTIVLLLAAMPAWAQSPDPGLHVGGVTMRGSGTVTAGYAGDYGSQTTSTHNVDIGASGTIDGYYYNPSFLNFNISPYYGQSRADSDSQSLSNSSGVTANVNLFTGSNNPISLSYGTSYNSTGNYGQVGTPNFTTVGNSTSFGVGWSTSRPHWPSLAVGYYWGTGSGNVYGTDAKTTSDSQGLHLNSSYVLWGLPLRGYYSYTRTNASSPDFLSNATETFTSTGNGQSIGVTTNHRLPLNGSFGISFDRSSSNSSYDYGTVEGSGTSNYTTSTENFSASFHPQPRLSFNASESYTDNLAGALTQSLSSGGSVVPEVNLGSGSKGLNLSGGASYQMARSANATVTATHTMQFYDGTNYSATFVSGTVSYSERLFKMFSFTAGLLDESQLNGNSTGYMATINYSHRYGMWETSANFSYSGNAQTQLVTYTNSSMGYGGRVARRLPWHLRWSAGFGGGHSGLSNVSPSPSSHSENYFSSFGGRTWALSANYSNNSGYSILTAGGLISVPTTGGITASELSAFSGNSYGGSASISMFRNLALSAAYSRAISTTNNAGTVSQNNTELFSSQLQYHYRRISLMAGYLWLNQGISASGSSAAGVTSYFVGVSRWFKFF